MQINSKPMAEKSVEMFGTLKLLKTEIESKKAQATTLN